MQVEGFPPQDQLRTIMVEHALQGEDTGSDILSFIASGPSSCRLLPPPPPHALGRSSFLFLPSSHLSSDVNLKDTPREKIAATLLDVGFSTEKQQDPVGSLSGGWKMKLELARAMLIGADILLLDEPTNHLGPFPPPPPSPPLCCVMR